MNHKPCVAITMGDPSGVGPEVIIKALLDGRLLENFIPVVIGNIDALKSSLDFIGKSTLVKKTKNLESLHSQNGSIEVFDPENLDFKNINIGQISASSGKASVEWILTAGELAMSRKVDAIVTAPINKEACSLAGYEDVGHMEIFQRQSGTSEGATMLMAENLRVVHLTTHKSLRIACDYVTKSNILSKIILTQVNFSEWGFRVPRIGVASLNPHGSDGGLLGHEEKQEITPAIKEAQSKGINVEGPIPPDTIFNQAIDGKYDVVLAMYHDQGHIPMKLLSFDTGVNVSVGLPIIRTSVDHGTAFDIAGTGQADERSLLEAIAFAEESDMLKAALGEHLFKSFIKNKKIEWETYSRHVTDYEIKRYLPIL